MSIDWTQMETAETRAAAMLEAAREGASLSRIDFAIATWQAGLITEPEMDAWLGSNTLPAIAVTALATVADPTERAIARARFLASQSIERRNPLLDLFGLPDAQVDALFGIG